MSELERLAGGEWYRTSAVQHRLRELGGIADASDRPFVRSKIGSRTLRQGRDESWATVMGRETRGLHRVVDRRWELLRLLHANRYQEQKTHPSRHTGVGGFVRPMHYRAGGGCIGRVGHGSA